MVRYDEGAVRERVEPVAAVLRENYALFKKELLQTVSVCPCAGWSVNRQTRSVELNDHGRKWPGVATGSVVLRYPLFSP